LQKLFAGLFLRPITVAPLNFKELLGRLQSIELTGDPRRVQSTFVTGLKTLPVRYRLSA